MNRVRSWWAAAAEIVYTAASLVVLGGISMPSLAADGAGQKAYALCGACHGQQGEGNIGMNAPKLAGQEPWYLRRQLNAFKSGQRGTAPGDIYGAQMRPMAMAVADPEAIENLIAYIATFPESQEMPIVSGDAGAGGAAFPVCAACHGQAGEGNEQLGGPRLAGQSDWYLVRQLNNFNKGLRGYDPKDTYGNQMKPMAASLTSEQAVNDVVAYIETLD